MELISYLNVICAQSWEPIEAFGNLRSHKISLQQPRSSVLFDINTLYLHFICSGNFSFLPFWIVAGYGGWQLLRRYPDQILTSHKWRWQRDSRKMCGQWVLCCRDILWSVVTAGARSQGVVISGEPISRNLRAGLLSDIEQSWKQNRELQLGHHHDKRSPR